MKTATVNAVLIAFLLPTVASADVLQVSAKILPNSNLQLSWNGVNYRIYRVQFKTNLTDAVWQDVPGETVGCADGATRVLLTTNQPQRFLRIADIGTNGAVPLGFPDANGNWLLYHHFSLGLVTNSTNTFFVTHGGYALQAYYDDWEVTDGPATKSPEIDQFQVFNDLMNDDRVKYVYPGRTDFSFQHRIFYDNVILFQLKAPFSDVNGFLTEQHLALVRYLPVLDIYIAATTRKTDDPFFIVQLLGGDPRLTFADIDLAGTPREDPCHFVGGP